MEDSISSRTGSTRAVVEAELATSPGLTTRGITSGGHLRRSPWKSKPSSSTVSIAVANSQRPLSIEALQVDQVLLDPAAALDQLVGVQPAALLQPLSLDRRDRGAGSGNRRALGSLENNPGTVTVMSTDCRRSTAGSKLSVVDLLIFRPREPGPETPAPAPVRTGTRSLAGPDRRAGIAVRVPLRGPAVVARSHPSCDSREAG